MITNVFLQYGCQRNTLVCLAYKPLKVRLIPLIVLVLLKLPCVKMAKFCPLVTEIWPKM